MANDITNVLIISSDDEKTLNDICSNISTRTDEGYLVGFDFNKIIPMPEELELDSGSPIDKAVSHALSYLGGRDVSEYTHSRSIVFNSEYYSFRGLSIAGSFIVPIPDNEIDMGQVELGLKYIRNLKEYGAFTWYDWSRNNWGTKWNSYGYKLFEEQPIPKCAQEVVNQKKYSRVIRFQTAWDPPFRVYTKFRDMLLDMVLNTNVTIGFDVFYADEDFGSNVGYIHFETNMIAHYSETKKYDDMSNTAIEVAADIIGTTPKREGYRIDPDSDKYVFDAKLFKDGEED